MKTFYLTLLTLVFAFSMASAQSSYLEPAGTFKANDMFASHSFSVFDTHEDLIYATNSDTVYCFDLASEELISTYPMPVGYEAYSAFLTVSPNGTEIWTGYTTSANVDDRIYQINAESGEWTLVATFTANFDLAFVDDNILVSGLNSANWGDPNGIYLLDISGNNNHRLIIETGGSPAGLSVSNQGNLFYGTSFFSQPNALYRWDNSEITSVIDDMNADILSTEDASKLSDIPESSYDCAADEQENIVFNFNAFSSDKVLAKWNGIAGDGFNFDTLAIASDGSDWLSMVKASGNIESDECGNHVFISSFGRPLAEVHQDYKPVVVSQLQNFSAYDTDSNVNYDLNQHFVDPDDVWDFTFEIIGNSMPDVAQVSIGGDNLEIDFVAPGQTNILLRATSAGLSVNTSFVVGVYPQIEGNFELSNFDDLSLEPNAFWNGSDLSGGFQSGPVNFPNDYNESWASWSSWAYSNMANDSSPGYLNQYSAITAKGFDVEASLGSNYGVGFVPVDFVSNENIPIPVYFNDDQSHIVKGLYVTNSTYAAITMEFGDDFTEKFGGESGGDPDYFMLSIKGYFNGIESEAVDFYLADYRFDDNTKDYVIKTWQWIDLSALGEVDSLKFTLNSSDVGAYGMNTPGYFCVDQMFVGPASTSMLELSDNAPLKVDVFPNPSTDFIKVKIDTDYSCILSIYDFSGKKMIENQDYQSEEIIDFRGLEKGCYVMKLQSGDVVSTERIIKL